MIFSDLFSQVLEEAEENDQLTCLFCRYCMKRELLIVHHWVSDIYTLIPPFWDIYFLL